jgi:hypothetical protein
MPRVALVLMSVIGLTFLYLGCVATLCVALIVPLLAGSR